jgi:hypothetical protein
MIDLADLFALFEEYCRVLDIPETTLSNRLYDESKKIALLRRGDGLTVKRFNHTVKYLHENWPQGAEWVGKIPRPVEVEA